MTKITNERLSEMVGAGVPCVPAQTGEIAAVVQELRALRSKPVAGVEVKPAEIEDLIERLLDAQQDINFAANSTMDQSLCDASALIDKVEAVLRRILSTLLPKATAPVVSEPERKVMELKMTPITEGLPVRDEMRGEQTILTYNDRVGAWDISFMEAGWDDFDAGFALGVTHWLDISEMWPGVTAQVSSFYASPQPEAVITDEMVERLRAAIISASGSWHPSIDQCRDLLAALKEA